MPKYLGLAPSSSIPRPSPSPIAMAVGSAYNVGVLSMSHTGVNNAAWCSFTSLVHSVLRL